MDIKVDIEVDEDELVYFHCKGTPKNGFLKSEYVIGCAYLSQFKLAFKLYNEHIESEKNMDIIVK